jgi:ribonucleotide monophosphatase NagD (HAD superfamily)
MSSLADHHDCLLLDLDGTVFRGHEATLGSVETLASLKARALYVTNNASRGPAEVAEHLKALGFAASPDDVVTSAQSAARLLADQLSTGSKVLVVGTESLAAEIRNVSMEPVRL